MAFDFFSVIEEVRLCALILLCLFIAPYTKVEESFNIQATHDLLTYGLQAPYPAHIAAHYDHVTFSGAVPRTFAGPVLLSLVTKPLSQLLHSALGAPLAGPQLQLLVRGVLGVWNGACLCYYGRRVRRAFGTSMFLGFVEGQFHLLYYASRTLPNFFAFGFVTIALADLLPMPLDTAISAGKGPGAGSVTTMAAARRMQRSLVLLTVMGIVFRSELAVLLVCHTLALLWQRRLTLAQVVVAGVVGVTVGLGATVPSDTFFWLRPWNQPLWPEFSAFVFNVVEGRSAEWGTDPVWHYFVVALPKLLFNPTILLLGIPLALWTDVSRRSLSVLLPNLIYVAILSLQGHKEWRFIIYVLPPLTAVASVGASHLWKNSWKKQAGGLLRKALLAAILLSIPLSVAAGFASLVISSLNYPGAAAINRFRVISRAVDTAGPVAVHMDTLTCMTGVTRFLELPIPAPDSSKPGSTATDLKWIYDKEEDERTLLDPLFWDRFDYAITESPERAIGAWKIVEGLGTVTGFSGIAVTTSISDLQRQRINADLAGDPSNRLADLGRKLLVRWNELGLSLSKFTRDRWVTIRMEPKLYVLRRTRGAL